MLRNAKIIFAVRAIRAIPAIRANKFSSVMSGASSGEKGKETRRNNGAMLFPLRFIFRQIFLKRHLCHFNDHAVTGCRNDVPTKARVSILLLFLSSALGGAGARLPLLSIARILNAFRAYLRIRRVLLFWFAWDKRARARSKSYQHIILCVVCHRGAILSARRSPKILANDLSYR